MTQGTRVLASLWVVSAISVSGCAGVHRSSPRAPQRPLEVVVLPERWMTAPSDGNHSEADLVVAELSSAGAHLVVLPSSVVAQKLRSLGGNCQEDSECVRRVGRELGADLVVTTRLAALGGTTLVRLSVLEIPRGAAGRSRQEVVPEATQAAVDEAVRRMARELAASFGPAVVLEDKAWYERWWVWTIAGGVLLAGSAVWIGIVAKDGDHESGEKPDVVVTPP